MAYVSNRVFDRKTFSSHATFNGNGSCSDKSLHPPTQSPDDPSSIC